MNINQRVCISLMFQWQSNYLLLSRTYVLSGATVMVKTLFKKNEFHIKIRREKKRASLLYSLKYHHCCSLRKKKPLMTFAETSRFCVSVMPICERRDFLENIYSRRNHNHLENSVSSKRPDETARARVCMKFAFRYIRAVEPHTPSCILEHPYGSPYSVYFYDHAPWPHLLTGFGRAVCKFQCNEPWLAL